MTAFIVSECDQKHSKIFPILCKYLFDYLIDFVPRSESAHGRRNCLQKEWRAKQCTKSTEPFETLQKRSNDLC